MDIKMERVNSRSAEMPGGVQFKIKNPDGDWELLYPITKDKYVEGLDSNESLGNLQKQIDDITKRLDDISYKPISITSLSSTTPTVERGNVLNGTVFNWSLSRKPKTQSFNGANIDISYRQYTYSGNITANKSFALSVTDERNTTTNSSTSITFYNGIYYGKSTNTLYSNSLLSTLTKVLSDTKNRTISVTAGAKEYIFYCIPTRLGACNFTVNGFTGGFTKISTTSFTNTFGFAENYDIYKSTNANLGTTNISIT